MGTAHFPDNPFLAALLYPLGVVYIIMGRYQLYTENTLPPVKLVLVRLARLPRPQLPEEASQPGEGGEQDGG